MRWIESTTVLKPRATVYTISNYLMPEKCLEMYSVTDYAKSVWIQRYSISRHFILRLSFPIRQYSIAMILNDEFTFYYVQSPMLFVIESSRVTSVFMPITINTFDLSQVKAQKGIWIYILKFLRWRLNWCLIITNGKNFLLVYKVIRLGIQVLYKTTEIVLNIDVYYFLNHLNILEYSSTSLHISGNLKLSRKSTAKSLTEMYTFYGINVSVLFHHRYFRCYYSPVSNVTFVCFTVFTVWLLERSFDSRN